METVPLPLFEFDNNASQSNPHPSQELVVDRLVQPLTQVLEYITPTTEDPISQNIIKSPAFKNTLDELFPEQGYQDKDTQKAKELLGKLADQFTPEQLQGTVVEIQYMAQSWLDDLERDVFKGLTLKEILHEKGGV